LRIAPKIGDYKITKGKKFKRSLSKRQMFIFEDTKEAEQFYNFVNIKFQLEDSDVYDNVPLEIKGRPYFFAWYEVEIPNKSFNLIPATFDLVLNLTLGNDEMESYVSSLENTFIRKGNWYLVLEVYTDLESDCLAETSLSKEDVLKYLRKLKKEYLATDNYNETVFKN
jgi:hypothetical protein